MYLSGPLVVINFGYFRRLPFVSLRRLILSAPSVGKLRRRPSSELQTVIVRRHLLAAPSDDALHRFRPLASSVVAMCRHHPSELQAGLLY